MAVQIVQAFHQLLDIDLDLWLKSLVQLGISHKRLARVVRGQPRPPSLLHSCLPRRQAFLLLIQAPHDRLLEKSFRKSVSPRAVEGGPQRRAEPA